MRAPRYVMRRFGGRDNRRHLESQLVPKRTTEEEAEQMAAIFSSYYPSQSVQLYCAGQLIAVAERGNLMRLRDRLAPEEARECASLSDSAVCQACGVEWTMHGRTCAGSEVPKCLT